MGSLLRILLGRIAWLGFGAYRFRTAFVLYRTFILVFVALFTDAKVGEVWRTNIGSNLSGGDYWTIFINVVFFALDVYTLFIVARFAIRYAHRRHQASKLVHLRVLLPKNDSKLDNEKRTEKDFHEALGKGEQLYRALHETRDLNLYNVWINRFIWGKPHISFELQYEKQEMSFVIVVDKYDQAIVEKQITSSQFKPINKLKKTRLTI